MELTSTWFGLFNVLLNEGLFYLFIYHGQKDGKYKQKNVTVYIKIQKAKLFHVIWNNLTSKLKIFQACSLLTAL